MWKLSTIKVIWGQHDWKFFPYIAATTPSRVGFKMVVALALGLVTWPHP